MKNCIILGCGRSGTSAVAGALSKSDYFMGDSLIPARVSNPDGVFEDLHVREINEEIISQAVPTRPKGDTNLDRDIPVQWQRWLARLPATTRFHSTASLETRIEGLVSDATYCFKDPRFSYALPIWRPHLKNCVFVCMFRDPATTAASILRFIQEFELMRSLEISFEQALDAWYFLNQHIIETHSKTGDWLFLHLEQLMFGNGLDRLEEFTGAKVNRSFIRPERQRTRNAEAVPSNVERVYAKLCELADFEPEVFSAR